MTNKSVIKYQKTHMKLFSFRFNKRTQADIIEHLESQENKAGYIARLIREDLIKQGKQPFKDKTIKDLASEMNDSDVVVLLFKDGSRLTTDKAHVINDNRIAYCYERKELIDHIEWIIEVRYA